MKINYLTAYVTYNIKLKIKINFDALAQKYYSKAVFHFN